MRSRTRISVLATVAVFGCAKVYAQDPPLTSEQVIAKVHDRLSLFRRYIPSLECDETVDSQRLDHDKMKDEMSIFSSLRVLRKADGDFAEERVKKLIDGKPAKGREVAPPYEMGLALPNLLSFVDGPLFRL